MLAVADLLAGLAAAVSLSLGGGDVSVTLWAALLAPLWLVVAKLSGLYDRDQRTLRHLTTDEVPRLVTFALVGTTATSVLLAFTPAGSPSAGEAVRAGIVATVAAIVLRAGARMVWRSSTPPERAVIIGDGALAHATRRKLDLFPDMHVQIHETLSTLTLEELDERRPTFDGIDRIILATSQLDERLLAPLIAICRADHIKLSVVPPLRGVLGTAVELNHVADLPVVEYNTWDVSRSTLLLKRVIDVVVSVVALVVLLPLFAAVALAVWVDGGRPILFRQPRAGQGARPFNILKFRTMARDAEEQLANIVSLDRLAQPMYKLRRDPRVTVVGRFLRRTSLDELPQLVNVLRGDMSLVGPRPEQLDLVARYDEAHLFRLGVKPGLTGPMQVFGRGELTFEERLAVERDYIENISVARDLRILALTFTSVFHGRGAF
jgi:exopolysaccharide biosynthesis polyprenyl glycosylphosphotransferase